jgi:hypothetical protein
MDVTPFTTIESAEEFLQLLQIEIQRAQAEIDDLLDSEDGSAPRRVEALRLVLHKLNGLHSNTASSLRLLHDLRSLRSLLMSRLQ